MSSPAVTRTATTARTRSAPAPATTRPGLRPLLVAGLCVAALLSAGDDSLYYAIIGDGPLRAELEELAASLGLADRVTFFNNPAAADRLVASARRMVNTRFSHEGPVAEYEALYERLLAAKHRAPAQLARRTPVEGSAE